MKLFLASSLGKAAPLLAEKWARPAKGTNVLFIANAADPYAGEKPWISGDREALAKLGFSLKEVDVREITKEEFQKELDSAGILHMCGGSVLYLMDLLRKRGIDKAIADSVRNGKVFYSATSAGSMIAAERLDLLKYDEEDQVFAKTMTDFSGLGLVNFMIVPHCNEQAFAEEHGKMVAHLSEYPQPLIFIQDNQAVWVEGEKIEILKV